MTKRSLRGRVVVSGIGESRYYRHGMSPEPEFKLALQAILAACEDAGLAPNDLDGFSSFGDERSDANRLSAALGIRRLHTSLLQWGGGGGGCCAAVANAAAMVATGQAEHVAVFRSLAQGEFGRFGQSAPITEVSGERAYLMPYGVLAPPQRFAMRVQRFIHEHNVARSALRAVALASSFHAQNNPRAVMYGKPLNAPQYDDARWITEPFQLYDCCMENDGAAALIISSSDNLPAARQTGIDSQAYLLGAATGAGFRASAEPHNAPVYASANHTDLVPELFEMAKLRPADVGSVQCYENFTGAVIMSLVEHGLVDSKSINRFFHVDNLTAPNGLLPLNTSGGNLAECYTQGMQLVLEAVRQIRHTSSNPATRRDVALVVGGPMVSPTSSLLFGSEATL